MEIRSVGAELLHADGRKDGQAQGPKGRIDMRQLMVTFGSFANATKIKETMEQKEGNSSVLRKE